jgi:hypothetical protein
MLKKYLNFLNEASLKDNPSVPSGYLSKAVTPADPSQLSAVGARLFSLSREEQRLSADKASELEKLAYETITTLNKDILELLKVDIEIKFVTQKEAVDIKKKREDEVDEENNTLIMMRPVIGDDDEIKAEIAKRDLANAVIQGEAKQIKDLLIKNEITKSIIEDGVRKIYGDKSDEIMRIWTQMLDLCDLKDRALSPEDEGARITERPELGLAGLTYVTWEPVEIELPPLEKEEEEDKEDDWSWDEDEDDDYVFSVEEEPKKDKKPKIVAVGVDFPMLLHEAQKGIYEFLAVPGLPEDTAVASAVLQNTGLKYEPEGWKYGPKIAKDLMNFFYTRLITIKEKNENEGKSDLNERIDNMTNIRQFFFRSLLNRKTLPTLDFLSVMKGILLKSLEKSQYTPEEQKIIDFSIKKSEDIITKLIKDLDYQFQLKKYEDDMKRYEEQMKEYERKTKEWEQSQQFSKQPTQAPIQKSETEKEKLEKELSQALSDEDYEKAAQIRDELKKLS